MVDDPFELIEEYGFLVPEDLQAGIEALYDELEGLETDLFESLGLFDSAVIVWASKGADGRLRLLIY